MRNALRHSAAILLVAMMGVASAFAQAPGFRSAVIAPDCDRACLVGFARSYMDALAHKDISRVRVASNVRFTENNVELPLGKAGLWATVTGVEENGLEAADPSTAQVAWLGAVHEHGLPVYFAVRLKVEAGAISEVESVVVRTTGLPLPFGDVTKLKHDSAFEDVLTPEQRRPRERLLAVADSYFNTVELNDGMVFAPFHDDCSRIENGIFTTSAGQGSGGIAAGCENQFKLGIYRINKRIRERRYPIVDVERGVVVATGFFDHANEFDRYKTTDGIERKTLLKWPNSISLIEAFKILDGRIYRIEAVFTYVPYFMHSPFYAYPAMAATPAPKRAAASSTRGCDSACLVGHADAHMEALVRRDPSGLAWAPVVRYTENSVSMNIGEGQWGSVRAKSSNALRVADPETGNVAWYGTVSDHDAPAYYAMRLKVENGRIAEVQAFAARERNPGPFGDPKAFKVDPALEAPLDKADRLSRSAMGKLAEKYASTAQQNDGVRVENGAVVTTRFDKPVDQVRGREIVAIDPERGLVVMTSFADFGMRETSEQQDKYPSTRELFEIYKVRRGGIERIEAVSVFQPYGMPSPWTASR